MGVWSLLICLRCIINSLMRKTRLVSAPSETKNDRGCMHKGRPEISNGLCK